MSDKTLCKSCDGAGSVPTGIDEYPETACNRCEALPLLPHPFGSIDVYHDDARVTSVDGFTADQMRGFAIDYAHQLGRTALAAKAERAAAPASVPEGFVTIQRDDAEQAVAATEGCSCKQGQCCPLCDPDVYAGDQIYRRAVALLATPAPTAGEPSAAPVKTCIKCPRDANKHCDYCGLRQSDGNRAAWVIRLKATEGRKEEKQ